MTAEPAPAIDLRLDPRRANQIAIFGRKGQGKSELAHYYWDGYPGDRLCVDTTGDVWKKHPIPGAIEWSGEEIEMRFPERTDEDRPVTVFYTPDQASPTYRDDVDAMVGLAYGHEGTMLWVEEIGEVAQAGRTLPHMRRALHQGRHQRLNLLMTGPRPMDIDPLVLANADIVCCFDMPNPADRKRVADSIGLDQATLDANIAELGDHEYFAYTATPRAWAVMPPLPLGERKSKRSA